MDVSLRMQDGAQKVTGKPVILVELKETLKTSWQIILSLSRNAIMWRDPLAKSSNHLRFRKQIISMIRLELTLVTLAFKGYHLAISIHLEKFLNASSISFTSFYKCLILCYTCTPQQFLSKIWPFFKILIPMTTSLSAEFLHPF